MGGEEGAVGPWGELVVGGFIEGGSWVGVEGWCELGSQSVVVGHMG